MVDVELNYQQNKTIIQSNLNDSLKDIITKYTIQENLDINNVYFISNEKLINKDDKLENIMNESEKINKKKIIFVYSINSIINNENANIKISNDVICPKCKEICKYEIKDYKIKLSNCKNGHLTDNIKLDEFKNKQVIDISQIKCDICKNKNKSNTNNNDFYICFDCKINLCPLCKSIHDETHTTISYDNKNYICNKHNEINIEFCEDCNMDICLLCINEHKNHKVISYKDKLIDITNLRNKMNEFENEINKLKINLEEIINKFKKIIDNFYVIYNINNNIINNFVKNKNTNYNSLLNLNCIDNYIDNEIDNIRNKYNYGNNLNQLLDVYKKMTDDNYDNDDEIEIIYLPNVEGKVKIFGSVFVDNNINKCKIIYNNKEYELREYLNNIDKDNKDTIKIKLKGIKNVTDMSYMFHDCKSLYSIPDLFKWNTSKFTDFSFMFFGCESLSSLPDLSKWNTSNVNNMMSLFQSCESLSSLPDLSKWNTYNVTDMSYLFCSCKSLSSLPDISKWDTFNVTDMAYMFHLCESLSSVPDISKWDTSNVTDMTYMFYLCESLSSLPDISKWDTSNVTKMEGMFYKCESLSSLPDISKWETSNVTDMAEMFEGCKPSLNIPSKFIE